MTARDAGLEPAHRPSSSPCCGPASARAILYKIVDLVIGLRATPEAEREGLDLTAHGEAAYHS